MNRIVEISQVNRPVRANLNNRIRAFFNSNNSMNLFHVFIPIWRQSTSLLKYFICSLFLFLRSAIIHLFSSQFLRIRILDIHDAIFFLWLMIRYYFTPQSSKCHRNDMLTRKHCTPIQILFIKINRVVLLSQWNWLHIQNTLTEHEQKRIAPVL